MNATIIDSPNHSDLLLALYRGEFAHLQCRAVVPQGYGAASFTMCVLPKDHDDAHQGVHLLMARRAIAWLEDPDPLLGQSGDNAT